MWCMHGNHVLIDFSVAFCKGIPDTRRVHTCWGTPRNEQEGKLLVTSATG